MTKKQSIIERAYKTFAQAFVASLILGAVHITPTNGFKTLLLAAIAAGVSAVWNAYVL